MSDFDMADGRIDELWRRTDSNYDKIWQKFENLEHVINALAKPCGEEQCGCMHEVPDEIRRSIEKLENEIADLKRKSEKTENSCLRKIEKAITWLPRRFNSIKDNGR